MLKTFDIGNHFGTEKTSPRKASRGCATGGGVVESVAGDRDARRRERAASDAGIVPPLATIAARLHAPPNAAIQRFGRCRFAKRNAIASP